jgi:hypothetical protein
MGVSVMDGTIRVPTAAWFATAVVVSVFATFELPPVGRSRWLRGRVGLGLMILLFPGDGGDVAEGGVSAA